MSEGELARLEKLAEALGGEGWARGRTGLSVTEPNEAHPVARLWYDDGGLCAEVHDNMGLGFDGKDYAAFFAASVDAAPRLIKEVRRLRALRESADE